MTNVRILACVATLLHAVADAQTVTLRNGVEMPMIAAGVWEYNSSEAQESVEAALSVGFKMIDTALDYHNQDGVGKAIKSVPRESVFLETKVPGCGLGEGVTLFECRKKTQEALAKDLQLLNVSYVDLVILHFPPLPTMLNVLSHTCEKFECGLIQDQWSALESFYNDGKARAIGVSNYCPSCFDCLFEKATILPMVNQVQYHIGMGKDPQGFKSYADAHGIVMQAYSALATSKSKDHDFILNGNLTNTIASNHNKSAVQVALKYIVQQGIPAITKSSNPEHLAADLDLFSWNLTSAEMHDLDAYSHEGIGDNPSFACKK